MKPVFEERDTFSTVYKKDYVWHEKRPDNRIYAQPDAYALSADQQSAFFDPNSIKAIPWDEQLAIIRELYARRMRTTYYKSYCEKLEEGPAESEQGSSGDTLIDSAEKLFAAKTHQKVLQPPATARRTMGYCRPARYRAGLSEYQDEYSRTGLRRLAAAGRDSRLEPRLDFCDQFDKGKH